jgi:hypothetical protein
MEKTAAREWQQQPLVETCRLAATRKSSLGNSPKAGGSKKRIHREQGI